MLPSRLRPDHPLLWLIAIVVIGGLVRLAPVIGSDFPVGDGGLFATMIGDIRGAGFGLPTFTSYNGGDIPFAYPPLALYVGAALPLDPLTTLRWLPALLATACIVAVYDVGNRSEAAGGLPAAAFYALAPFGWTWLIQGGGLTRGLALLLALAAVAMALRRRGALSGMLGGLTALTHPETAAFAAFAVVAVLAFARAWRALIIAGAVAVAVVVPWLWVVIARHGVDPLVAAAGARAVNPLASLLSITGDRPGVLDLAGPVGLVGLLASGIAWLYVTATATTLALTTSLGTHMAPLFAVGVGETVTRRRVSMPVIATTSVLLLVGAGVAWSDPGPLGVDDRRAMEWIAGETPADARVAVLSNEIWSKRDEAEWLPHLTGRESVVTMQGREWLPGWRSVEAAYQELAQCETRECVTAWAALHETAYMYLADDCCQRLAAELADDRLFAAGSASVYGMPKAAARGP